MSFLSKRLMSTIKMKPTPSKAHHHYPLPSSSFPEGFVLGGIHAGVKKKAGVPDLAVILSTSERPTTAAACFTRNAFKAAPVIVSNEVLKKNGGYARAVVVNSGCANAVTGKQGMDDAWAMVQATDGLLSKSYKSSEFEHETLVMSTGVIGQNLPISKIVAGIKSQSAATLGSDFAAWERAAQAFMTTDTFPKLRSRTFTIGGVEYRMAGMDKGAGMIHPDMGPAGTTFSAPKQLHATLLGCIMTDAAVSPKSLQSALTYAVDRSFNSISVDGDMSTNDSIYVLANGAAAKDGAVIDEDTDKQGYEVFKKELTDFAADLAKLVVRDGEGATKFVTVTVKGAPSYKDAHNIASRISTSALVKTALYGEDANWGRILAATGSVPLLPSASTGATPVIDPKKVNVTFVPSDGTAALPVLVNGEPEKVDEVRAKEILTLEDFEVLVELGMEGDGEGEAQYWTCDFSYRVALRSVL
ncbi:Arginine biosynthesis bifunctional protein ArgJ, mitochondrial [Psilocybe cubensis]|uniref:Arginine biosynthesis bifunctional protein ArgJ, mitochondrial n=1 Tax=Psilocybe cubensis TaxID=181762 RepID=A0ACB8GWB6_PSICU|nr:Arginine biosynthesis bifunctional protein ArgJ, mitochondrial [Psilocybe cubensis]KAH9479866.1 Arginine biosynthesis bifunctional protein ArgJ, mitochondrial [Psilocybe cubensis]